MNRKPLLYVALSAALFGISPPIAKVLVGETPPVALAGLLYIGAFLGLFMFTIGTRALLHRKNQEASLMRHDAPWLAGAIITGGILAPISLMMGLALTSGFAASLLVNLEGVMTAVIAVIAFREFAGPRLWLAMSLMTIAGVFLSWNPNQGTINPLGPLLIVFAMFCWGVDNNLTRQISSKDPVMIAEVKGLIAGSTSLAIAVLLGSTITVDASILFALLLGALSYGVSLVLFVKALDGLGSSRTAAFFSFGPFVGAVVSVLFLGDAMTGLIVLAAALMFFGVLLVATERHAHSHRHEAVTHTHEHERDLHHEHEHPDGKDGPHVHEHVHPPIVHSHVHWPDREHRHEH
ncbi:MAG TPA: EamA family transporter [Methanomassiliicoccales archaeon]|nr:EamA family transporter [Methanomassiliicoccales archaeon]